MKEPKLSPPTIHELRNDKDLQNRWCLPSVCPECGEQWGWQEPVEPQYQSELREGLRCQNDECRLTLWITYERVPTGYSVEIEQEDGTWEISTELEKNEGAVVKEFKVFTAS